MTAVWVASLGGMLLLCLGMLVGTSWADQMLGERYRHLAIERRELNEWRHALQEANRHCVWCGDSIAPTGDFSRVGGRVSAVTRGDPLGAGTAHAVAACR
ncbi:MAG: hypothetical protein WCF33_15115 [Pseudonocardiaceae bacterium]